MRRCGGYYECPTDAKGNRLGPLVGYASSYENHSGVRQHFVGEKYVDFAMVEQWPSIVSKHIATPLCEKMLSTVGQKKKLVLCGAPEGAKCLAALMAECLGIRYVYPKKVESKPSIEGQRAQTTFLFDRHHINPGDEVVIVEDVCHNFSTTMELIRIITAAGGTVNLICCFLNRSERHQEWFTPYGGGKYRVVALWNEPMPSWTQASAIVADDIANGNVVWKPKQSWRQLHKVMKKAA